MKRVGKQLQSSDPSQDGDLLIQGVRFAFRVHQVLMEPIGEVDPVEDIMQLERDPTPESEDPHIDDSEDDPTEDPQRMRLTSLHLQQMLRSSRMMA
ncbi:hypothetical protein AgCh_021913 [Apium graveolens]